MSTIEEEMRARIEAALYAAGRPLDLLDLGKAAQTKSKRKTLKIIKDVLKNINENMRAVEIVEIPEEKFVMQLKSKYTKVARKFSLKPLMPKAVLKTLSHIVYLQPVSSSDIIDRRGSQAYSHLKKLRELGFIELDRKGRKKTYRTTDTFSEYFGVSKDPNKIKNELKSPRRKVNIMISKGLKYDIRSRDNR